MTLYSTFVFLHVATAILGLGPLTVLAVIASGPAARSFTVDRFLQFLRVVGASWAGMFVTGAILIAFTHGALGETRWLRVSFGLFLLLGFLYGMARRQLRKARQSPAPVFPHKALSQILWSMCATTAAITYLMEAKPW